jgi:hypothetical protein
VSEDQNWRLKAELDIEDRRSALDHLIGRVREPDVIKDVGEAVPHEVMITHDGNLLFAYAATKAALTSARSAVEAALRGDGIKASVYVSYWDEDLDRWQQVDPPLSGEAKQIEDAAVRDAEAIETRTMVVSTGKFIRSEVERTMLGWAEKLGLECKLIEHPHLLTSQIAFTVRGPKRRIEEFADGLKAEQLATMRTEREVMLSPL